MVARLADTMDYTETAFNQSLAATSDAIPAYVKVAGATLGVLIILLGAFGNLLIISAVLVNRSLYRSSNMFVVSLAVCDLAQSLLVKPFYVHTYLTGEWRFGADACVYALYAGNLAVLESISHVAGIAVHRYLVIVHPRYGCYLQRGRWIAVMLAVTVSLPVLVVVLPNMGRWSHHQQVVFNRRIMFCSFVKHSNFRLASVLKKVAVLSVFATLVFYCYVRIYLMVRRSGHEVISRGAFSQARLQREITLLKTVVVIFAAFVLTYMPISVLYAADTHRVAPFWLYFVGVALLWLSASVNWVIYGLMNSSYRRAYLYLLCGCRGTPARSKQGKQTDQSTSKASYNVSFRELPIVDIGRQVNARLNARLSISAERHERYG